MISPTAAKSLGTGRELLALGGHIGAVHHAVWDVTGKHTVTASSDGTPRVWDGGTGRELFTLRGHTGPVLHAAWDAAGERIVTTSDDGSARIYLAVSRA